MSTKASKNAEQSTLSRAISADKKRTSYTDRSSQQNPTARMVSDNHLRTFELHMCVSVCMCACVVGGFKGSFSSSVFLFSKKSIVFKLNLITAPTIDR